VIVIGAALTVVVADLIARAEYLRDAAELDRAAASSRNHLLAQVQGAEHALRAIRSLFIQYREVSREEFRLATEPLAQATEPAAGAWLERNPHRRRHSALRGPRPR
jgi:CHASE1-domain containing sensor protein